MKCSNTNCVNELSLQQQKGGGRFCCRSCSNSAIPRISSAKSKAKVGKSISRVKLAQNSYVIEDKKCKVCGSNFMTSFRKRANETCSAACSHKLRSRRAASTMKHRGTNSGWHNRKGEPSYPEKYFMSIFQNEVITGWVREKKVGRWFIDFAFEQIKIAVEIDGRQHDDSDRKASDLVKDEYLKSQGWEVIRIRWTNPSSEKGKSLLYPQIEKLKNKLRTS